MSSVNIIESNELFINSLKNLQKIRNFNGDPAQFWTMYLDALVALCSADVGMIALQGAQEDSDWKPIVLSPQKMRFSTNAELLKEKLNAAAQACKEDETALLGSKESEIAALALNAGINTQKCLALFYLGEESKSDALEKLKLLQFVNDIPENYQLRKSAFDAIVQQEHFSSVLDLMVLINAQDRFLASAMTFCNELAARHACERVSLGWFHKGYMRIQAMSHMDNFDKKMEAVQKLELAMEEAVDQDTEIVIPSGKEEKTITRDHVSFTRNHDVEYMFSLPIRVDNEPVAVCSLERKANAFSETEMRLIRLSCDQCTRRLADLKKHDRWFGARLAGSLREKLADILGYEHTWGKVLAIVITTLLAVLCFVPVTYRLDSPVILRTDDVSYLTAPFDGHIEQVQVRVGDEVKKGDTLLNLDKNDLVLEESGLKAEMNRYRRESEKARAADALADMRIADAVYEQSAARLDLVRHHLSQVVASAPFNGVIVEGDQIERVGSPVKQGDVLFKIARIDRLYAELEVKESEIHNLNTSLSGEIALASRPQDVFKIKVFRIEPAAVVKNEGNVFLVHCKFPHEIPSWWRPGMTGVSKLNAGKRTFLWILTHRTIDFLRLKLWW